MGGKKYSKRVNCKVCFKIYFICFHFLVYETKVNNFTTDTKCAERKYYGQSVLYLIILSYSRKIALILRMKISSE